MAARPRRRLTEPANQVAVRPEISATVVEVLVRNGDRVEKGQAIAIVDGPKGNAVQAQLHFELRFDGEAVDPLIAAARDVMEGAAHPAIHLDVPLVVDVGISENWAGAH